MSKTQYVAEGLRPNYTPTHTSAVHFDYTLYDRLRLDPSVISPLSIFNFVPTVGYVHYADKNFYLDDFRRDPRDKSFAMWYSDSLLTRSISSAYPIDHSFSRDVTFVMRKDVSELIQYNVFIFEEDTDNVFYGQYTGTQEVAGRMLKIRNTLTPIHSNQSIEDMLVSPTKKPNSLYTDVLSIDLDRLSWDFQFAHIKAKKKHYRVLHVIRREHIIVALDNYIQALASAPGTISSKKYFKNYFEVEKETVNIIKGKLYNLFGNDFPEWFVS